MTQSSSSRIYKYDNAKAFLIFLVVVGHLITAYAPDSLTIRRVTLWIFTFHMPAFVLISGLVHKQYITADQASLGVRGETRFRSDKFIGFLLCAYLLKVVIYYTKIGVGLHPVWSWIEEPAVPWYLVVMAEYELFFYIIRRLDAKTKPALMIAGAFALSAAVGYVDAIGDAFCLARFANFLPIYMIGYYMDMRKFLGIIETKKTKLCGWIIILASIVACRFAPWGMYYLRKWITGRRSYYYLCDYFSESVRYGWFIRLAIWAVAIVISLAIITVIPNRNVGYITTVGSRTLQIYFWHRPVSHFIVSRKVLPKLYVLFGGVYDTSVKGPIPGHAFCGGGIKPMLLSLLVYLLLSLSITAILGLDIFKHPTSDLMKLASKLAKYCDNSRNITKNDKN